MELEELRKKALSLPTKPGVYVMMDKSGAVIYVGKAKQLRSRVSGYFRDSDHDAKTTIMVSKVNDFDTIIVGSEFEALVTENSLIKHHSPKYNIKLKDDKGYPYVRYDLKEEYPRFKIVSKKQDDGARYLGPFGSRTVMREAIDSINKALRLPTCSRRFPQDIGRERPCLNFHMGICSGWCRGKPGSEEYKALIVQARMLLEGKNSELCTMLTERMEEAAQALRFEQAAELRDRLKAISSLSERQMPVSAAASDCDIVGYYRGAAKACFAILKNVEGRLMDKDYRVINVPFEDDAEALSTLLVQYYTSRGACPSEIALPLEPSGVEALERLLSEDAKRKVTLTIPKRGEKARLVSLANINAFEECERASSIEEKVLKTLEWLQKALSLPNLPERIEAYDVSNTGDSEIVGSMTVFDRQKPVKKDYRRFRMKTLEKRDDYASMREMLKRRIERYLGGDEKFSTLPDLILIDGGAMHAAVGRNVLKEAGIDVQVFGMVKDDRHKTRALVSPEGKEIGISANPAVFSFIGRIQEETHRFAIEYNTKLHTSSAINSLLDKISGIGENRRKALIKGFGSIKAIKAAGIDELSKFVPKKAAQSVYDYFHCMEEEEK